MRTASLLASPRGAAARLRAGQPGPAFVVSAVVGLSLLLGANNARALPWPGGKAGAATGGTGIQAGVTQFKSHEKCVEDLGRQLPAEAASQVLGTDPVQLICVSRHAVAKDDPEVCRRELKDYNQRNQCLRFFAVYAKRPLDCPTRGWPTYHEGLCHALAVRNPSLCLAVASEQRPLCLAVLRGEAQCGGLAAPQAAACRREAQAWRGVVKAVAGTLPAGYTPSLEVRAAALTAGLTLPPAAAQFKSTALETGLLVADQSGTGDTLVIDRNFAPQETYSTPGQPPLDLELQAPLPATGVGSVTIGGTGGGTAKVSFRESGSYRYRTLQATSGTVTVTRFARSSAGQIGGTFSLELTDGVDRLKIEGQFATFVRELIPLSSVASYVRYRTSSGAAYGYGALPPAEVQQLRARMFKVKEHVYDLDPSLRAELAANTTKLTEGAAIGRPYSGASPPAAGATGWRLYSVYQNSTLWLLGFRDNDTLKKINGKALESKEDLYEAYPRLKKAPQIVVVLDRAGAEVKLTYRIKKVAPPKGATLKGVKPVAPVAPAVPVP